MVWLINVQSVMEITMSYSSVLHFSTEIGIRNISTLKAIICVRIACHQTIWLVNALLHTIAESVPVNLSSLFNANSQILKVVCHVLPCLSSADPPSNVKTLLNLPCIQDKAPLADPYLGGSLDIFVGARDVA